MSGSNSDDQGNMSDHGNATTSAVAVWDDKAVSDMYLSLAEVRGGFSASEAKDVEARMREKGYNFTAKQLLTKHGKVRAKMAAARPAGAASNGNGNAEAKPKANAPKGRAKAAPKVDADGNQVTKAKTPRKPAAKRVLKTTPKKEADDNGDEVEAETPPNKKRKASGPKAGKKIVQETVKEGEAEEKYDAPEGEGDSSMIDADDGSESNELSAPAAAAKLTKDKAESDAEMTKVDAAHAAEIIKADAQVEEDVDAPEGEFAEQMELVQASKSDDLAEETVRIEAHVVQTSA